MTDVRCPPSFHSLAPNALICNVPSSGNGVPVGQICLIALRSNSSNLGSEMSISSRTHDANPSGEDRRRVVDRPQELNQIGAIRCVRYKVVPHTSVTIL